MPPQLTSGAGRTAAVGAMPSVELQELIILFVANFCNKTYCSTRQRPCQPRFPINCLLTFKVPLLTVSSCRRDRKSPHAPQISFIEARLLLTGFTPCPARCGCRCSPPTSRRRQALRPRRVWMVQGRGSIPACAAPPAYTSRTCAECLSPRVRGNHLLPNYSCRRRGSIPACAGEPPGDLFKRYRAQGLSGS